MKSELDRAYNENIGRRIREEMKKKHMTLDELSQKTGGSVPKPTLARYVRGENAIPDDRLQAICNALNVDYLLLKQWAVSKSSFDLDMKKYDAFSDPSWSDHVSTIDGHEIDPFSITVSEALLIGYYRAADQSRQKAARIILGMDE